MYLMKEAAPDLLSLDFHPQTDYDFTLVNDFICAASGGLNKTETSQ